MLVLLRYIYLHMNFVSVMTISRGDYPLTQFLQRSSVPIGRYCTGPPVPMLLIMLRSFSARLPLSVLSKQSLAPTSRSQSTFTLLPQRPVEQTAMQALALAQIVDQVKVDVLSKTMADDNAARRRHVSRSFISDTITVPSEEMYAYAVQASLGDDVYEFEPSTNALEEHIARLTGKEAALFVPSGTMSNQLALRTHLKQPPYSVLADHRSHIHKYEAGATAFHSGASLIPIIPSNGRHLTASDIEASAILERDIHFAPTEVVAIENTLNGTIIPQEDVSAISRFARLNGILTHLDGARIWHAAVETGLSIKELCDPFDSVSVCFNKGLGAPMGSCLAGAEAFVRKARWFRKIFGGGMRQTGMLAACAAYALSNNFARLPEVHKLTRYLEQGLLDIGVAITSPPETCMIFYDPSPVGLTHQEIAHKASQLPEPITLAGSRVVLHIHTTKGSVDDLLSVIRVLADQKVA